MLTDRLDFQAWLAEHDAKGLGLAYRTGERERKVKKLPGEGRCDGCGGPLGDTPSQLREICLICLAERFGGDQVEEALTKLFIGGAITAALGGEPQVPADLIRRSIDEAFDSHEERQSTGMANLLLREQRERLTGGKA